MKVLIGLSGGVDSAAAAALLKDAGHDVAAFTLLLGHADPDGVHRCCRPEDIRDARLIADRLAIPHYVWDFQEEFKTAVMDVFEQGYAAGITPNPCGICNRTVRFGMVFDKIRRLGFDAMATGHYARIAGGRVCRGADAAKDQSYFLSRLRPDVIASLIFPLGGLTKADARRICEEQGLGVQSKPESQEICFVTGSTGDYLDRRIGPTPGDILDDDGQVVGRHAGIHRYTPGQRRGLGVSSTRPLYVSAIDARTRTVRLSARERLERSAVTLGELTCYEPLAEGDGVDVQLRHRAPGHRARVARLRDSRLTLELETPAFAPAPGQIGALYRGDAVIGSGVILSSSRALKAQEAAAL